MGGTTAKACVIRRGEPSLSPDYFIGGYNEGLAIRIPVLDIVEVGTGGGSIAFLDEGGGLHVGPRSAGAEPGPASYGRGGTEPTVTDANVILGRLSPERFLGGEMRLDSSAAEKALTERLARPLNLSMERAAAGMLQVATSAMANAVRHVTLERGLDPREFERLADTMHATLDELWSAVAQAVSVDGQLALTSAIVPAANEVIDLSATREWMRRYHMPASVIWLLGFSIILCGAMTGHALGEAGHRHLGLALILNLLILMVAFVVLDFDRPRRGLIRVDQTPLIQLRESMRSS
jgi:hypothetical protein